MIKLSNFRNKHFLALAGNLVISFFSVMNMSLLYRSLNKIEVGSWFFFLSFFGLADAFRSGFLATATVKFYAGSEAKRGKSVLGSVWFIAAIITISVLLLNLLVWLFLIYTQSPQFIIVTKWIGITFLSSLPFAVGVWILMADERYGVILLLRLINTGSMFVIIAVLLFLHKMNLENLFILNIVTYIFAAIFLLWKKILKFKSIFSLNKNVLFEIFQFGKYSLGSNISAILFKNADNFIITFLLGPAALAIYNLPCRLMEMIEIPLRSFIGTGMSAMAKAMNKNNKEELLYVFKKYAGMLTFAIIPIVFCGIVFADLAVTILGGAKYQGTEAANIFRVFIFFSLLFPIDRFNGVALDMLHLPKINLQKVLIMLSFSIIGNLLAIYFFKSLYGVAFASPVVIISGLFFGNYYLKKHLKYTLKDILVTGLFESKLIINKTISSFQKSSNN